MNTGTGNIFGPRIRIPSLLLVFVVGGASGCAKQTNASHPPQGPQLVQPTPGDGTVKPTLASSPAVPPAAPVGAPLSQPNPLALGCTQDIHCLTHRCNVAAGKCAWPCQTDNDCMPGNTCISPTCLPKLQ